MQCSFGEGWDASYDIGLTHWGLARLVEICGAIERREPPRFDKHRGDLPAECDLYRSGEAQRILHDLVPLSTDKKSGIHVWCGEPFRHTVPTLLAPTGVRAAAARVHGRQQRRARAVRPHARHLLRHHVEPNRLGLCRVNVFLAGCSADERICRAGRGRIRQHHRHALALDNSVTPTAMDNEGNSPIGAGTDVVNIDPCAVAAGAEAFHKLLLQSYHGVLRVFPAVPSGWEEASFHRLRAQRGFEVTAMRKKFATQWVAVRSIAGAPNLVVTADFTSADVKSTAVGVRTDANGFSVGVTTACLAGGSVCSYTLNATLPANTSVLIYPLRNARGPFVLEQAAITTGPTNGWGWHDGWGCRTQARRAEGACRIYLLLLFSFHTIYRTQPKQSTAPAVSPTSAKV